MTGNDIVDLKLAKIPEGNRKSRFYNKIFTGKEKEILKDGEIGLWSLWAMKEAVYKAHHRRFNLPRYFDPKRIEITIPVKQKTSILSSAEYEGLKYYISGILCEDYIHVTATCLPKIDIYHEIHKNQIDIKGKFLTVIAEELSLRSNELSIAKNGKNIPEILFEDKSLKLPFSLSHHGKYSAFSFQLINY